MQKSTLYVIGNGFDLHHRIPSKYSAFQKFVNENSRETYDVAMRYIFQDEDDLWNEFEERLASLDVDELLDDFSSLMPSYGAEDWSDSGHHDYQYEIDKVLEALSRDLHVAFYDWVRSLEIPSRSRACGQLLNICPESEFLSFNYTNTLEIVYGVASNKILHLHGQIDSQPGQTIIGHRGGKPSLNSDVDFDAADPRFVDGNFSIDDYFKATSKPVGEVIRRQSAFFEGLSKHTDIVVLGHSFGPVDVPYFQEIASKVELSVNWSASINSDADSLAVDAASDLLFGRSDQIKKFAIDEILLDSKQRNSLF